MKQPPQTRATSGMPHAGSAIESMLQLPQKTPPQQRQWCLRRSNVNSLLQELHVLRLRSGTQKDGCALAQQRSICGNEALREARG
mmetsp:Transcript_50031/g.108420  ORF Transcript_50031/g.108420 Transcript_50031/m.108420 type:complete len:85 (-) Transcript_50031:432-686(-)